MKKTLSLRFSLPLLLLHLFSLRPPWSLTLVFLWSSIVLISSDFFLKSSLDPIAWYITKSILSKSFVSLKLNPHHFFAPRSRLLGIPRDKNSQTVCIGVTRNSQWAHSVFPARMQTSAYMSPPLGSGSQTSCPNWVRLLPVCLLPICLPLLGLSQCDIIISLYLCLPF